MKKVDYSKTKITGGFWKEKQELIRSTTVKAVYDRFYETGRIDALKCEKSDTQPHIFWDSDVAKWIEGVAYLIMDKREPELEKIVDELISDIVNNQDENGYFNSYYNVIEPENRFTNRDCHELYCLGHLIEASVAYYEATGKDKFLNAMRKYADYVERVFKIEKSAKFATPGHEEIELALVRLYDCTKEKRYLELSKFFVDIRGTEEENLNSWCKFSYNQSHKPVREQDSAVGHAVRATYLYCAMADLALKYNDENLKRACEKIFDNIINKKMYITGGIGSSCFGENFTVDYDLPNMIAYTESCAALGLILFANRMLLLDNDSKYSDTVERALYNGFLSSISLDGKGFFYSNPLEILPYMRDRDNGSIEGENHLRLPNPQRQEVFECSCCPPNIVRFIPSVANLMYTYDDNTIYVHQFIEGVSSVKIGEKEFTIKQKTNYPYDSSVAIEVSGGNINVAVRIPYYNQGEKYATKKGYAYFEIKGEGKIHMDFKFEPRFVYANSNVLHNAGKCAVMKGPLVYCMEEHDNGGQLRNLSFKSDTVFTQGYNEELKTPTVELTAARRCMTASLYSFDKGESREVKATLIPYFAFANRGECEMTVWLNERD